jgi:hypothetical protein
MNALSESVKDGMYAALAAIQTCFYENAFGSPALPYYVFQNQSNLPAYAFSYAAIHEDDIWVIKSYCDSAAAESAGKTAEKLNNERLQAAESAIRSLGYSVLERRDLNLPNETQGDRIIYASALQIRIVASYG